MSFIANYYFGIKAFHIISVISWMAAMLYLPRLFVYHCGVAVGSETSELFKVMERRLERAIMTPAMIASLISGAAMLTQQTFTGPGSAWLHIKLTLLVGMFASHHMLQRHRLAFAEDRNKKSSKYFRILNEVPTLLMVLIVIFVVTKPF